MSFEDTFKSWASPPSQTEQEKCDNAARQISTAIRSSSKLSEYDITVFPQGSYRNRTNVRRESDVDICVLCTNVCFADYQFGEGLTDKDIGLSDHPYTYTMFKNDAHAALNDYFGASNVQRGNKAFDIHENSYRVDADVVACFEHRRYMRTVNGGHRYESGTEFRPDNGGSVINWPNQNYDNGVTKNKNTSKGFKAGVRILKRLRNTLEDNGYEAASPIPSYLLECLAWNVPDVGFHNQTYTADVRYILTHLINSTISKENCDEWGEINELKYLFRGSPPWTVEQVHKFVVAAWDYIGFK